jgi:hypothetical protein
MVDWWVLVHWWPQMTVCHTPGKALIIVDTKTQFQ